MLPSSALWLFRRRERDLSAKMFLSAFSDFHSSFSVSMTCFFCVSGYPLLKSSIAPFSMHLLFWCCGVCGGEGGVRDMSCFSFISVASFILFLFPSFSSFPYSPGYISFHLIFPQKLCFSEVAISVQSG